MPKKNKQGGKKSRAGRWKKKPSNQRYANTNRRARNKLKRVARSNGHDAALAYAKEHSIAAPARRTPSTNKAARAAAARAGQELMLLNAGGEQ